MQNKLHISGNKLIYQQDAVNKWELPIESIQLIGEYTTSAGPYADDYFFVFIERGNKWWEAPSSAIDHQSFWSELGQHFNATVLPGLASSVDWATRVIFPSKLEGNELFKVIQYKPKHQSFWNKILGIGSNDVRLALADNIKRYIND